MPLVKVSDNSLDQPKLVVANDFKTFIEKAEKKLGYKIDKIVRQSDASEIDDEEVFEELLKEGGELWFVCLRENEEYPLKVPTKTNDSKIKSALNETKPETVAKSNLKKEVEEEHKEEAFAVELTEKEDEKKETIDDDAKNEEPVEVDNTPESVENAENKEKTEDKDETLEIIKTIHKLVGGELDAESSSNELMNTLHSIISDKELENVELFTKDELNEIDNGNIEAAMNSFALEEVSPNRSSSKSFKNLASKMVIKSKIISAFKPSEGGLLADPNNEIIKTIVIESSPEVNEKEDEIKMKSKIFKSKIESLIRASRVINNMMPDNKEKTIPVISDLKQIPISNLFAELINAEKVDVCFLIDCTGSMKPYIDEVKQTLNKIVDKLKIKFKSFELRVSFVGYRDHLDQKHRIVLFPFSDEIDQFKSFVTDVRAGGGADLCEDVFGGLEQVCNLDWSNPSRILLHICDAPCHGRQFHDESVTDDYPDGDPRGLQLNDLLKCLIRQKISYYFAEINQTTTKMVQEFNKELARNNSKKLKLFKLPKVSDLTELISKSILQTIKETKLLVPTKKEETKHVELSTDPIDWSPDKFKKVNAVLYKASYTGDIDELKTKPIEFNESNIELLIADKPFDKGSLRYAYAGLVNVGTNEEPNYVRQVVKQSIFKGDQYNTINYYKDLIENQVVSSRLAKEFFELTKPTKSLRFIDVNIVYVPELNEYYSIEEFIEGDFVKWISNDGVINEDIYSCTLDAFSHWSYEVTKNYLVVTDLQGTLVANKEYILTDPAITCPLEPNRFANTNLGSEGLKDFFSTHQCNHICRKLNLKKHELQTLPDREENEMMTKLN